MSFETAYDFIKTWEGGYVNHPKDPGGATNLGVTQRVYDAHRRRKGLPVRSVREITQGEAGGIYFDRYWTPAKCPALPSPLALVVFDGSVNQGVGATARLLQQSVKVGVDGKVGPITLRAVNRAWRRDSVGLIVELCARRALRYAGTRNRTTFGLGWFRRLCAAEQAALALHMEG